MSVLGELNHIKETWHEIRLHSCGSFQKHSNESWPTQYIAATWVGGEGGEGRRGGVNKRGRSWTFEVGFRPTELLITETASSQLRYYDLVQVLFALCTSLEVTLMGWGITSELKEQGLLFLLTHSQLWWQRIMLPLGKIICCYSKEYPFPCSYSLTC